MRLLSKEKLNFYRFLALKLVDDDLYPHYQYGEAFSLERVRGFWKKTVRAILENKAPQKLGIYIHIPFCHQKCHFCFCDSYVPASYEIARNYLRLLKEEIDAFRDIFKAVCFTSVYFGGGSPSFLKINDLNWLFRYIYRSFKISPTAQIIFEGTPADLNKENLALLSKYGVDRLTIGVQSLDPKVIKLMGRPQTKEKFIRVFRLARRVGIAYINVDLIAGLEGQTVDSFLSDLKIVLRLGADMVHVTGFTPLSHTPFSRTGKILSLRQRKNREIMIAKSRELLSKFFRDIDGENGRGSSVRAGNIQEIDMRKENSSLLGIGYSAQSHAFSQAWYKHPYLVAMKQKPDYKELPVFWGVRGSLDEEMRKFVFNNLQGGFSRAFFYRLFKKDVIEVFKGEIDILVKAGRLKVVGDRILSNIRLRKEFRVLSKIFYSQARINAIFDAHRHEYNKNNDYQKELDILYADTD